MAVTVHVEGKSTTVMKIAIADGARVDAAANLIYVYAGNGDVLGIFTPANVYGVTVDK